MQAIQLPFLFVGRLRLLLLVLFLFLLPRRNGEKEEAFLGSRVVKIERPVHVIRRRVRRRRFFSPPVGTAKAAVFLFEEQSEREASSTPEMSVSLSFSLIIQIRLSSQGRRSDLLSFRPLLLFPLLLLPVTAILLLPLATPLTRASCPFHTIRAEKLPLRHYRKILSSLLFLLLFSFQLLPQSAWMGPSRAQMPT